MIFFRNKINLSNFIQPTVTKILLLLVFIITCLQLLDSRAEYPFFLERHIERWYIHHDEKLIIPDARYFYLVGSEDININDYKPYPVSAAFGIAGPALTALGFNLFGMNNTGLRFFFIIISGITSCFCILSILKVAPGRVGFFFSIIYLLNY
ncbi:MAG: hypothetical protein ABRQ39_31015, partial [Candidatus Eremiobacterota bacterium]